MMSEVEKARHKQMMLNKKERSQYNGVFMGMSTISIAVLVSPNWASLTSEAQLSFVFTHPPLPLYTLFTDKFILLKFFTKLSTIILIN